MLELQVPTSFNSFVFKNNLVQIFSADILRFYVFSSVLKFFLKIFRLWCWEFLRNRSVLGVSLKIWDYQPVFESMFLKQILNEDPRYFLTH